MASCVEVLAAHPDNLFDLQVHMAERTNFCKLSSDSLSPSLSTSLSSSSLSPSPPFFICRPVSIIKSYKGGDRVLTYLMVYGWNSVYANRGPVPTLRRAAGKKLFFLPHSGFSLLSVTLMVLRTVQRGLLQSPCRMCALGLTCLGTSLRSLSQQSWLSQTSELFVCFVSSYYLLLNHNVMCIPDWLQTCVVPALASQGLRL